MIDALKLIIAKSPRATKQAMDTIRAINSNSPVVARRYEMTAQEALNDSQADFTADDKALIASYLTELNDNAPAVITLRCTKSEKEHVQLMADAAGLSLSDYIRGELGIDMS